MPLLRRERATSGEQVHRITSVRRSLTDDVRSRQTRYVISMGVRTVCFILAVVTSGWWRAIFFAAAVVLPYVSVVFANAGRERSTPPIEALAPPARPQLGPAPDPGTGPNPRSAA